MNRFITYCITVFLLLTLSHTTIYANNESNLTIVDVLIVYSQEVEDKYKDETETRINHLIEVTNQIYTDSHLNIMLNPIKLQRYPMDENASSKTIITQIQEDKNISNIRDEIGADEVIIYRPYVKHDICGIAYINHGQVDYAFAHISINCSSYHTAHEVGHSMGLYHSIKEHPHVGYARGHGVENEFSTIMSYTENFNANKIYKFSSPKLNCNGFPCGIEEGEEYEADAVKALQSNAFNLSKFKTHTVTLEELKKAKQQYEKYRDEFTSISQTLEKIQEEYQKVEEAYNQTLSVSKAEINNYQKRKSEYLRLKNNLLITKAQKYYDKSLRPLTEKLKKYKFSNLYVTLTKKNKLEQTYKTYKSNIYDIAQQKLERAEQFYFKLQNLYGVNNAD